jgi:acetyl-CoA carboxylase biotin carboxyl carrier protein
VTDKKKEKASKLPTVSKGKLPVPKSIHANDAGVIKELSDLLKANDLTEIEYEKDGLRLRVARGGMVVGHPAPVSVATGAAPAAAAAPVADLDKHPGTVKSPMVGTVYFSPKPGAEAFIKEGSSVTEGQTILIIEAMKVMNPIKATRSGKVIKIFVQDAHPVEFDEPLVIIE